MCGIVGVISKSPQKNRINLKTAADTLMHRGPDSSGEWWSENRRVGFAHRRLSIIDISENGKQPMIDKENKNVIILNGEIYNYKEIKSHLKSKRHTFVSNSDTEVLLKAYAEWGVNCLEKLNGMFAFAIFDPKNQILFLARDRAGEKPLFYHLENGTFRFASELKALLVNPDLSRNIDGTSLDSYLSMGFVPGHKCILKGFNKLPPAHAFLFDLQTSRERIWRYWNFPESFSNEEKKDEVELLAELEILLEDSVRRQLVADVPVGIMLSGGVDSSLLTAMATRSLDKVKTFCVSFPGHGKLNEAKHAQLIANYFDTEHIELEAQDTSANLLTNLVENFDEPIVDSSMIPTFLLCQMVKQHCTVALGGDGGDELFGGYSHYSRLLWMQRHLEWLPIGTRKTIAKFSGKFLSIGTKGRNYLQSLNVDFNSSVPPIALYFDSETRSKLLNGYDGGGFDLDSRIPNQIDFLQRMTHMDFENYLPEDILVKVDRTSMANSLELRAPFLDKEVIEFAFGEVPSYLKASFNGRKILLKKLAKNLLPKEFNLQRKQGFSIPLGHWLSGGEYKELFCDILLDSQSIFDRPTVEKLFHGQSRGKNNSERLFSLVLFELWRRRYSISI